MLSNVIKNLSVSEQIDLIEKWKKFQNEYQNLSDEDRLKRNIDIQVKNYNNSKIDNNINLNCEKCKNKGEIAFSEFDSELNAYKLCFKKCECYKKRLILTNLNNSGFISNDTKYTFKNYDLSEEFSKHIYNKAKENINSNNWFFIGGQIGCGKTHICTAICLELLKKFEKVKFVQWRDLMTDIKNGFNKKNNKYDFEDLKVSKILFIDDFLHGKPTEFELEKAFEIIDFRYRHDLKTIISSELLTGELFKIKENISSRIIEKSKDFIIDVSRDNNKNYRLKK